jgi:hypothetical protein
MGNRSDLTIALRLQGDVADAVKKLQAVDGALDAGTAAADALAQAVNGAAAAFDKLKVPAHVGAAPQVDPRKAAQESAAQAFDTLGIRSSETILAGLKAQAQAYETLKASGVASAKDIDRALTALQGRIEAVNAELGKRPAADKVGEAFGTLGIRSSGAIQAEIRAQQQAFETLKASGVASAEDIARAELALQGRVRALNAELAHTPQQFKAGAVSAGQMQMAMRQLPAQMTDVVTSLASGMPAWMVLIQQGGQVRDSFGGAGNALKAIASLLTPLRLAAIGAAAGVGLLATAYINGEKETTAYNLAVQTTGNYAGATRGRIEELAKAAHEASGISVGAAREITVGLVQAGRLGIETIGNITKSVESYGAVTGQSVQQAATSLAGAFDKPAEGAAKLNEQLHFLSPEQLKYIRSLEEQGRTEEAQLELSKRLADHLGNALPQNLGTLQRAWHAVASAASSAWDKMLAVGRPKTLEQQIEEQKQFIERIREGQEPGRIDIAQQHLANLEAQKASEEQKAADDAATARLNESKDKADKAWEARAKSLQNWREKLAEETKKIREEGALLGKTQKDIDDQISRAAERLTPKASAPKANPAESAFLSQQQSLTVALAEAQQRLKNAKEGVAGADDQATVRLEAWLATNRAALKLTDAQVAKLRELAGAIDQAGAATRSEQELQAARERAAKGLADLEVDWLAATGHAAEASAQQIEQRFAQLRRDLEAVGSTDGLARLDVVIETEKARAQLGQLQAEIEKVFQAQSRSEQSVDAQVSAGLITQIVGQKRLVDLHGQTAQQIERYMPMLEKLAALPGAVGDAARANLEDLKTKLLLLKSTSDELQNALRNGLQNGIQQALAGLANGTMNLRDAIRTLMLSVADAMAQIATKQLAQSATDSLMGLFKGAAAPAAAGAGGEAAGAAATATAITTAGTAAATTMGASIGTSGTAAATEMGASVGAAGTGAAATMAAGIETSGLAAGAAMAASITSAGAVAAAEMAAAITAAGAAGGAAQGAAAAAMAFFDTGGYTGPGGVHEAAGIVHAGEFVTRQAVTHQPGALGFLTDFNERGMMALPAWAAMMGWRGYADGGLVLASPVTAPAVSNLRGFQPSAPPAPGKAERDRIKVVNSLDLDHLVRGLDGHAGFERVILNVIRVNPGTVQQYIAG